MPIRAFIRTLADPLFESVGQVFGFISARLRVRSVSGSVESADDTVDPMTRLGCGSEGAGKYSSPFYRSGLEGAGVSASGNKSYLDRPREWFGFV